MNPPPDAPDFDSVFREAKDRLKLTFQGAAERIGVSKKTLENWLVRPPNVHRRRAIVDAFPELPSEHRRRLAASLGVPFVEEKLTRDSVAVKAALEGALFEAAETLNAPARDVRKAFALLLARVAALGIDAATASALVGGKREG